MAELKICPFCGRIPTVEDCGDNRYFVRCKCGIAQDKLYGQRCDAVRRWNIRKPSAQSEQRWVPVKFRPMDSEEREYWEDQFGEELVDEDAVMFDCQMPEDGQEILVSYRKWIGMDKCEVDGGCYGLEGNGDWEGVVAWMPLPEPYKEENDGTDRT